MRLVVGGRAAGKSTEAVRWAAQDPTRRVVVAPTVHQAKYLVARAQELYPAFHRVDWSRVFTSTSTQQLRGRDVDVYVDEFEGVLAMLLGVRSISGVTATADVYDIGQRIQ